MYSLAQAVVLLLTLILGVRATTTDKACVDACSDWSIVLGHCRGRFGNEPGFHNLTFANEFLGCCCSGEENDQVLGGEKILASAGVCQSCYATPWAIKDDLSMLLSLCSVQSANGTAADAILFKPQGYATSQDRTKAGTSQDYSAAISTAHITASTVILTTIVLVTLIALA